MSNKIKALFAHDHRFVIEQGEVWSESQFEAALWERYLEHFDRLTVVARRGKVPAGKLATQLERSSVACVDFELIESLSSVHGLTIARWAAWRRMKTLVRAHDAVIARLPSEIGLLAIAAARLSSTPWAVEVVGCPWDGLWNYGNLTGRLYAPIAWLRTRRALRQANHAIYVTSEFLQRRYPTGAYNQASVSDVILTDVSPNQLHARHERIASLGKRPLRLGLIGTLHGRYKGIQTLLAALSLVRSSLPPITVHILGGGDAAPWHERAAELGVGDLVAFEGTLPAGRPIMHWLDNIDVYLQPSLQEGLPRALIEAMSRGCPALASNVAGIPELLPPEDLICPGNVAALAELLSNRLVDRGWMVSRATVNWETARNYLPDALQARRTEFWTKFRDTVGN